MLQKGKDIMSLQSSYCKPVFKSEKKSIEKRERKRESVCERDTDR